MGRRGIQTQWWNWSNLRKMMDSSPFRGATLHLGLGYPDSTTSSELDDAFAYLAHVLPGCASRDNLSLEDSREVITRFGIGY